MIRIAEIFYRYLISPMLHLWAGPGYGCRYQPTCSEYAFKTLREHGFLAGGWMALRRLASCHPWGGMIHGS